MAQIEIITEIDEGRGWRFEAQVLDEDGALRRHMMTLAWADYNHWSPDGAATPASVATAVIQFIAGRMPPGEIRQSFDASIARRMFPDADDVIPQLVAHGPG